MADPFDVTNSNIPMQGGGISPDAWRNLLTFGLATMQAASQPGAKFFGSLGSGGLAAMENSRANAAGRLQQQIGAQSLAGNKLDMAIKLNNLNGLRQLQGLPPIDANGAIMSLAPQAATGAGGDLEKPSIAEPSSGAGSPWAPATGSSVPNEPASYQKDAGGSDKGGSSSTIGGIPTSIYNKLNPEEQQLVHTGQLYTMYGQHEIGKEFMDAGLARIKSASTAAGSLPYDIQKSRSGFTEVRGGPGMPSTIFDQLNNRFIAEGAQVAQVMPGQNIPGPDGKPLPVGTEYRLPPTMLNQDQGMPPPQAAPQAPVQRGAIPAPPSPDQMGGAPRDAAFMPPQGGPTDLGGPIGAAALQAAQQAGAQPEPQITMGPGGMQANVPPPPGGMEAPQAPQAAQAVPGVYQGAMPTKLSPQNQELLTVGARELMEKERPIYETAQQTLASAAIIDHDIKELGPSGMGAGAQWRQDFAQTVNSTQQALGVKDQSLLFDPKKVAAAESFNKETLRLGFANARLLGAREAASVVEQAIKANPGLGSSHLGAQLLNGIIAENAQRQKDRIEYMHANVNKQDTMQSEIDFNKQYPGVSYVRRAVSQFSPVTVNTPGAMRSLLPGTKVVRSNNPTDVRIIPLPDDYQFSIPPTVHAFQGGE